MRVIYESDKALYSVVVEDDHFREYLKGLLEGRATVEYKSGDIDFVGFVESIEQSDDCPAVFHRSKIFRVAVCDD